MPSLLGCRCPPQCQLLADIRSSATCIALLTSAARKCSWGVQRVISSFTYNLDHQTEPHFNTDKTRPYKAIMVRHFTATLAEVNTGPVTDAAAATAEQVRIEIQSTSVSS